jgi:hypothetical protein
MGKKCEICKDEISETAGKLAGTMVRMVDDKKARHVFVCRGCQKDPRWFEKAKVKGA